MSRDDRVLQGADSLAAKPKGLNAAAGNRLVGLDSLRFICAFVVVLGHIRLLGEAVHGADAHGIEKIAIGLYNCSFNGPAAVIVFFVISGFCIHYPFRNGRPVVLASFFSRRFIRIIPPSLAFLLVSKLALNESVNPQDSVLWSIVCEVIYYLIYPVLLYLRKRSSWGVVIAIAYAGAALELATHWSLLMPAGNSFVAMGWSTWIIGLPCWLLGCWLAENYQSFKVLTGWQIWLVRIGVYGASVVLSLAKFHIASPLASYCITLNLFALVVCYWVGAEVAYLREHGALPALESAGRWSYSLYIVHPLVPSLIALTGVASLAWYPKAHLLLILIALVAAYGFYLAIEAPCHRLAVRVARKFAPAEGPRRDLAVKGSD